MVSDTICYIEAGCSSERLPPTGSTIIAIVPDKSFRVSCTQAGPDERFTQFYSTEITPEIYEKEIAPARTFVFYEDVEPLLEKGLIKGGSLENAVVIKGEAVMSKEPLRFPEEFARHKILDIVGDLYLLGHPLLGAFSAHKSGHALNNKLLRALMADKTAWEMVSFERIEEAPASVARLFAQPA